MCTLIAWGAAADRWGERVVLSTGLGLAGLILLAARSVHGTTALAVCLALAGASAASVLASGRLILGWFARHERALAMGLRQSAGPMGLALAAARNSAARNSSGRPPPPPLPPSGRPRRRRTARPACGASTPPARC